MKTALIRRLLLLNAFFLSITFLFSSVSYAAVVAFDSVAVIGKPVMLKAQTKRLIFPKGGRLVEFYMDEKHMGRTLSGGDGYAFLEYLPRKAGLRKVEVRSDDVRDNASILVMRRNDRVIFIEIEGGLFESILSNRPREGSKSAIKGLLRKYRIVYITTMLGTKNSGKWLKEKSFPLSVILSWTGPELFDEIKELGTRLYAVIGSPDILSEASEYTKKRYSFEETEDGVAVKDWEEVLKLLK